MPYDKPYLTYEEQLEKLKNVYNLKVTGNIDFNLMFLSTVSYYDLINGYKDCFMQDDKFINETTLSDLFVFNVIDKKFQNILFLQSIYVENIFKTKMAYLIAKTRGVEISQYLDKAKYHSPTPTRNKKLEDTINDMISIHDTCKDDPTKYYKSKHNHIPPWILFKNVKFNTVIDLFSFFKKDEKLAIISEYSYFTTDKISDNKKFELFKNMITIIRKFRNKIAHNYKIIEISLDKTKLQLRDISHISPHKLLSNKDIIKRRGEKDLYAMVISLFFLVEPIFLKLFFVQELKTFKIDGSVKYFEKCNFPNNFIDKMEKISTDLETELSSKFN